jgi:hypothetical protein
MGLVQCFSMINMFIVNINLVYMIYTFRIRNILNMNKLIHLVSIYILTLETQFFKILSKDVMSISRV